MNAKKQDGAADKGFADSHPLDALVGEPLEQERNPKRHGEDKRHLGDRKPLDHREEQRVDEDPKQQVVRGTLKTKVAILSL